MIARKSNKLAAAGAREKTHSLHFSAFRKLRHNCFSAGCCSVVQPKQQPTTLTYLPPVVVDGRRERPTSALPSLTPAPPPPLRTNKASLTRFVDSSSTVGMGLHGKGGSAATPDAATDAIPCHFAFPFAVCPMQYTRLVLTATYYQRTSVRSNTSEQQKNKPTLYTHTPPPPSTMHRTATAAAICTNSPSNVHLSKLDRSSLCATHLAEWHPCNEPVTKRDST